MSRAEVYPWKMLGEVGDYFVVPASFKPPGYVAQLVAQKNYQKRGLVKYSSTQTTFGTIVVLVEVGTETPPYEFVTPEGILCITSRQQGVAAVNDRTQALGDRPVVARRTQAQLVDMMSLEQKQANLPWWHDPRTKQLVWNAQVATEEDTGRWVDKKFNPGRDDPYPEYYGLDENLQRRESDPGDEPEDEDVWAGLPADGGEAGE